MTRVRSYISAFMALLLAFAMMPMVAFGAGTVTLSIKAQGGHTYKIYQVVTGDVVRPASGENGTVQGILTNPEPGQNLKAEYKVSENATKTAMKDVADIIDEHKASETTLADKLSGFVDFESVPYAELTAESNGTLSVENVPDGYYMIVDVAPATDAASRFIVTIAGEDLTITPKVDTAPTLNKVISAEDEQDKAVNGPVPGSDGQANTAAIGDYVKFTLTSFVPIMTGYDTYQYIINDTMSEGLTLVQGDANHPIEFLIDGNQLVEGVDYSFAIDPIDTADNSQHFTLSIDNLIATVAKYDVTPGIDTPITVTYYAQVNDQASIGNNANENTAWLEFSNNPRESGEGHQPGGETPKSTTYTFVNQIIIKKVGEDGTTPLTGAEFTLTATETNSVILNQMFIAGGTYDSEAPNASWYALKDGKYTQEEPTDRNKDQYKSTDEKYALVSSELQVIPGSEPVEYKSFVYQPEDSDEATVTFTGLNAGKYKLTESIVPEGYNNLDPIEFELALNPVRDDSGNVIGYTWVIVSSTNGMVTLDENGGFAVSTIQNNKGLQLPSTGGIGTIIFTVVGAVIIIGAVAFLVVRRRRSQSEE